MAKTEPGQTAHKPYLIGVTGNIACGKSTVLARLAEHGAETIDADRVVHTLMEPGEAVWSAIREAFGPGVIAADGRIDRRALGAIVFADRDVGVSKMSKRIIREAVWRVWHLRLLDLLGRL